MDDKNPYKAAPTPETKAALPPDADARVISEARQEGIFAGLTSGLVSAIVGQRLMGFNRNKTLVCGAITTLLAGYYFTQAFTSTGLAQLHVVEARLASGTYPAPRPGNLNPKPQTPT